MGLTLWVKTLRVTEDSYTAIEGFGKCSLVRSLVFGKRPLEGKSLVEEVDVAMGVKVRHAIPESNTK